MVKDKKPAVVLISGGLDSAALIFWLIDRGWQIFPLHVDYGQVTEKGEWVATQSLLNVVDTSPVVRLSTPDVAKLASGTLTGRKSDIDIEYFPSRNLFLLTLAAMYAHSLNISTIMLGLIANSSEIFPDTSPTYLASVQTVLRLEYPNISVKAPFVEKEKTEIVSAAIELGLIPELTFSCNRLAERHCWHCSSCADRLYVFNKLNII